MSQTDVFWGLSNTAWTALSSISTLLAVMVALYFPISERLNRRKKICRNIESEIRKNFRIIEKARTFDLSNLVGQSVPKSIAVAVTLGQIDSEYWEVNRQFVSEYSFKKFTEYSKINNDLKEMKLLAQELLAEPTDNRNWENFMIAFENEYQKMKLLPKYW